MDIQTQVAVLTGGAALAGSIVGSVASFYTTRMLKREEWNRERREKDISRREEIYIEFYEEATRLIFKRMDEEMNEAKIFSQFTALLGQVNFVGGHDVCQAANQVGDDLLKFLASGSSGSKIEINLDAFVKTARQELEAMKQ